MSKTFNRAQIAEILGVTPQTVSAWIKEEGLPCLEMGVGRQGMKLDPVAVVKWYAEREVRRRTSDVGESTLESERLRLTTEQANEKAISNAQQLGRLLNIDDVTQMMSELLIMLKSQHGSSPSRLAKRVSVEESASVCRAILKDEFIRIQSSFANVLAQRARELQPMEGDGENIGAATE